MQYQNKNFLYYLRGLKSSSIAFFFVLVLLIASGDLFFFLKTHQYLLAFVDLLTCYIFFLLPIFFFRKHLKQYAWLLLPVIILTPFNALAIIFFDVPINDATILLIFSTNYNEASELIRGYLLIFIPIVLVYFGSYFLLISKLPTQISVKLAATLSICSIFILSLLPFASFSPESYFNRLKGTLYFVFPTSIIRAIGTVYKQKQLIDNSKNERNSFTFGAKQITPLSGSQIFLLIIGESSRYNNWGINGYQKNTSPNLSKRSNLISFNNVASGGFITEFAVPLILTGVGADQFKAHFKQKSIVSAFKEAGFTTYWITNQIDDGHIKIHLEEADKKILLLSDFKSTKHLHQDMELVKALKKVFREPGEKKFIVMHTLGSHYDYSARYPNEFDVFKPSNKSIFTQSTSHTDKNIIINSYDNSILYTDAVIDSSINMIAHENAFSAVTYISDHGENLFDDSRNLSQHGYPYPSKYISHIPYFVWYSDSFQKRFPEKIENLKKHVNADISSENIIYTFTSMGNISYPKQDSSKNISSPYFKNNQQRILGANMKVYNCNSLK